MCLLLWEFIKSQAAWIKVRCHVLISQYLQEFLLSSSPFHPEKGPCHLSEYGKGETQARLNLLPIFPASPHPWHRRVISLLALCAKIFPNALGSPPFNSLCCPRSSSPKAIFQVWLTLGQNSLSLLWLSRVETDWNFQKSQFKRNGRKSGSTEAQLGLSQDSKVFVWAQTLNSGDEGYLPVSYLLGHSHVRVPPCFSAKSVLDDHPLGSGPLLTQGPISRWEVEGKILPTGSSLVPCSSLQWKNYENITLEQAWHLHEIITYTAQPV